jgi:putative iron-only hydrogenase system regulator
MERIAVIGAVLENPESCQEVLNKTEAGFRGIIRSRMGTPFDEDGLSVVSIIVKGELDDINALTGKLGNIEYVTVKTAISNTLGGKS